MDTAFQQILREVAVQLCGLGTELSAELPSSAPSLVFPAKRPRKSGAAGVRVSEAEARTLFAIALSQRSVPFAIEVPTGQQYSFKGATPMSARIDLVAYGPLGDSTGALRRSLGIEFKAHNPPPESIGKDLEKLMREGHDGLWFHVLHNIDSVTLDVLLAKFRRGLEDLASARAACRAKLTIALVVLGKRLFLFRTVDSQQDWSCALRLGYVVRRGRVEVRDVNGWSIEAL
jgi:hypothetical protein